eukprot:5621039-Prymnesium_polylepis.2
MGVLSCFCAVYCPVCVCNLQDLFYLLYGVNQFGVLSFLLSSYRALYLVVDAIAHHVVVGCPDA